MSNLFASHVNSPEDATHALTMANARVPFWVMLRGLKLGFSWSELLNLFIKFGLPALIKILEEIFSGLKKKEDFDTSAPETPPEPPEA